jgi:hypothetical protein
MPGPDLQFDDARALAQGALELLYFGDEVAIDDRATIEHEHGWAFFYDTPTHLQSGALADALAGRAPILVDRKSGRVLHASTSQPWEDLVTLMQEYDR